MLNIVQIAKKLDKTIFWVALALVFCALTAFSLVAIGGSHRPARDLRAQADLGQMRALANESIDREEVFDIDCEADEFMTLCQDVEEQTGFKPAIFQNKSQEKYCIMAKLPNSGRYFCVDSSGGLLDAACNNESPFCSKDAEIDSSYFPLRKDRLGLGKIGFYIYSIAVFIIFAFSWVMLLRKNKIWAIVILLFGLAFVGVLLWV